VIHRPPSVCGSFGAFLGGDEFEKGIDRHRKNPTAKTSRSRSRTLRFWRLAKSTSNANANTPVVWNESFGILTSPLDAI